MNQQEGSIKFNLQFSAGEPPPGDVWREINAWRRILYLARLIGQDPGRYAGFGYGNVSRRLDPFDAQENHRQFVITGAQTGGIDRLTAVHFVTVRACFPDENRVIADGPIVPSSESMTHAAVYAADDRVRCVMHVHSPELWQNAHRLGLLSTSPDVPCGSPEMAAEVRRLFDETNVASRRIFAMGGHEDGIISFASSVEEAGTVLLTHFARALQHYDLA